MAEYIEREKAIEVLLSYPIGTFGGKDIYSAENRACRNEIQDIPAADVAPVVHGRWKENDNFDDGFWVCSSCGFVSEATAAHKLYKFCPNCGADMREE